MFVKRRVIKPRIPGAAGRASESGVLAEETDDATMPEVMPMLGQQPEQGLRQHIDEENARMLQESFLVFRAEFALDMERVMSTVLACFFESANKHQDSELCGVVIQGTRRWGCLSKHSSSAASHQSAWKGSTVEATGVRFRAEPQDNPSSSASHKDGYVASVKIEPDPRDGLLHDHGDHAARSIATLSQPEPLYRNVADTIVDERMRFAELLTSLNATLADHRRHVDEVYQPALPQTPKLHEACSASSSKFQEKRLRSQ